MKIKKRIKGTQNAIWNGRSIRIGEIKEFEFNNESEYQYFLGTGYGFETVEEPKPAVISIPSIPDSMPSTPKSVEKNFEVPGEVSDVKIEPESEIETLTDTNSVSTSEEVKTFSSNEEEPSESERKFKKRGRT